MKVAVVGGGPAGLYFARLLGRARTQAAIDLFERGPEGATWGFGVGLGGRTMAEIAAADPEVHDRVLAAMRFAPSQTIRLNDAAFELRYADVTGAISRLELLKILTAACREVGVRLRFDAAVESAADLQGYDLIVAADGAGSALRRERELALGVRRRALTNHFAWYGVARAMPMGLAFRNHDGGTFVGHHYAYAPDMSTFVAECDEATWRRFGFEAMGEAARTAAIERVFAPELAGARLIDNRSQWRRFMADRATRFYDGRLVLLGDSLRVAHFSIGSGTRLAMEDASALNAALAACEGDVAAALPHFEDLRRPVRETFGAAAQRSFEWYERVAEHMAQPLLPFIHDFLTRTGRIDDARLRSYAPEFHAAYQRYREGAVAG